MYCFAMPAHGGMCEQRIARGAKIPHLGAMECKLSAEADSAALQVSMKCSRVRAGSDHITARNLSQL